MSAGADFQESFLLIYSTVINLILGLTLAGGILIALIQALLIGFQAKRAPEIERE